MNDPRPLVEAEARAVEAVWRRGGEGIPGRRLQGVGCLVAFAGMLALTLTPALANFIDVDAGSAYAVLALAIGLLGLGALLGLAGASRDEAARPRALDDAVDRLIAAHAAGGPAPVVEAATVLVRLREAGPGVDFGDVARRLGSAAAVVRRVEAHLMERGLLPPAAR